MFAGSICESTNCDALVWLILGVLAGAVLLATVVTVAWGLAVAAVLARRGWSKPARAAGGVMGAMVVWMAILGVAEIGGDIGDAVAWSIAIAAVPVAVWQRRVTRAVQSSPCSTA